MAQARVITCRDCDRHVVMSGFCFMLGFHNRAYSCCEFRNIEREDRAARLRGDKFHPKHFKTLSEWYAVVFEEKRGVPTAVPHGIQTVMSGLNIGFHEAFDLLIKEGELIPAGTGFIIDLSGPDKVIEKHKRKKVLYCRHNLIYVETTTCPH